MSNPAYSAANDMPLILTGKVPYEQEAEEAVIGAVLTNPEVFGDICPWLGGDDFYIMRHTLIWQALRRLHDRHDPIDYLTVQAELRAHGDLNNVGGPAYLTQLMNSMPTSMHAEIYGRIVQRCAIRRRLMAAGDTFKALAQREDQPVEWVLGEAEKQLLSVRDTSLESEGETFRDGVSRFMDAVEARMMNPDTLLGVTTGFRDLDDVTGGLNRGDLWILAGRPGMGKTAMMLSVALNAAKRGKRVGIASQEMDLEQIIARFAAMETGINLQRLRMGRLDQSDWRRFVGACGQLARLPLHVDDASGLTPGRLRMKALRWMRNGGIDVLMVDYLQIMSSGGLFKGNERVQEVGYFVRSLKALAKELRIPVLAAAQLSRALESRQDKRPQLSDLRESGEIEQEADIVTFLYRDVVYNEATEFPNRADVIIAKHRNGPTGIVSMHFEKSLTKFTDQRTQTIDLSAL